MVGKETLDPSDVGKHPKLIKTALKEMSQSDVLICGKCHEVFHFIDSFQEHKENDCVKESPLKDCRDSKPKIWAFLLWKASQIANSNSSNKLYSWELYQQWIRLDEQTRDTWIVAGKTILSFAKLSQGVLNEMPVKITKTVVENLTSGKGNQQQQSGLKQTMPLSTAQKLPVVKKDESEEAKLQLIRKTVNPPMAIKYPPMSSSSATAASAASQTQKNTIGNRLAKRTIPNTSGQEIEDEVVEKIIAKRFNPRRKLHEYLVKWEDLPHDQNTWEPQTHLETCAQLLDTFEKQLAKQKEQRAKLQQQQPPVNTRASPTSPIKTLSVSNRPIITSTKIIKKADIHEEETPSNSLNTTECGLNASLSSSGIKAGIKRKVDESSISDFDAQEFDDDDIPTHAIKKIKNGASVSVKTGDSKVETKVITQQSQAKTKIRINDGAKSSPAVTADNSNVIITKDSQTTGVFKKSGSFTPSPTKENAQIRVLSKGESGTTGVVRVSAGNASPAATQLSAKQKLLAPSTSSSSTGGRSGSGIVVTSIQHFPAPQSQQQTTNYTQRGGAGGPGISPGNTAQISQVQTHRIVMTPKDNQVISSPLPSSTSLTIKPSVHTRIVSKPSPQVGRGATATTIQRSSITPSQITQRNFRGGNKPSHSVITPEQKIIQLSKSGDLKVTRRVITQPVNSHLVNQQQHQQQGRQGPRQNILHQQRQHQLHTRASSVSKSESEHSHSPIPSEPSSEPQFTLCEITGKVIRQGPGGEIIESDDKFSEGEDKQQQQSNEILQAQIAAISDGQVNQQQVTEALTTEDGTLTTLSSDDGAQQFLANEDGTPILVTGEDGTIYQVAGKNAEGQTILIAQNAEGDQQLAYIASEEGDESGILNLDNSTVSQMLPKQQQSAEVVATTGSGDVSGVTQYVIKQDDATQSVNTGTTVNITQPLEIKTIDGEVADGNIPAEVVQADLPSPGGTRRVVLLLQDGTFMMTEMHDDEYQALNLVQ